MQYKEAYRKEFLDKIPHHCWHMSLMRTLRIRVGTEWFSIHEDEWLIMGREVSARLFASDHHGELEFAGPAILNPPQALRATWRERRRPWRSPSRRSRRPEETGLRQKDDGGRSSAEEILLLTPNPPPTGEERDCD
jgi:hypothetical protein